MYGRNSFELLKAEVLFDELFHDKFNAYVFPAFPGAGGSINDGILDAALTPKLIRPTTFAEISGNTSERAKQFSKILRHAHIPYQKVVNMHMWQLCHLAMVVPIADAYYEADCPERAGKDWKTMKKTAKRLKRNFSFLRKQAGCHLVK